MMSISPSKVVRLVSSGPRALSDTLSELMRAAGRGGALLIARGVTLWYGREFL